MVVNVLSIVPASGAFSSYAAQQNFLRKIDGVLELEAEGRLEDEVSGSVGVQRDVLEVRGRFYTVEYINIII